jgi:magnesium transporter
MYLSVKKNGGDQNADGHEDLELLLESFSKQVTEIVNEAESIEVRQIPHAADVY